MLVECLLGILPVEENRVYLRVLNLKLNHDLHCNISIQHDGQLFCQLIALWQVIAIS